MNQKPRFRLRAVGKEWLLLPVNDAAVAMKIQAWKLYTPIL